MEEKSESGKKEIKKARKALGVLLGKLRKKCGTFTDVNEWLSFVKQNADPVLSEFKAQIPPESLKALEQSKHVTSFTKEAVNQACNHLQLNTEKVIKLLPSGTPHSYHSCRCRTHCGYWCGSRHVSEHKNSIHNGQ